MISKLQFFLPFQDNLIFIVAHTWSLSCSQPLETPKFTSISIFRPQFSLFVKRGEIRLFSCLSRASPLFCRIPKLGLQREFSGGLKPSAAAAQITCWPSTAPQYRWLGRPAGLLRGEGSACSPVAVEVVVILSENSVGTRKNFNVDWPVGSSRAPKSPTRAAVVQRAKRRREKRQTPGHHNNKSPAQF